MEFAACIIEKLKQSEIVSILAIAIVASLRALLAIAVIEIPFLIKSHYDMKNAASRRGIYNFDESHLFKKFKQLYRYSKTDKKVYTQSDWETDARDYLDGLKIDDYTDYEHFLSIRLRNANITKVAAEITIIPIMLAIVDITLNGESAGWSLDIELLIAELILTIGWLMIAWDNGLKVALYEDLVEFVHKEKKRKRKEQKELRKAEEKAKR